MDMDVSGNVSRFCFSAPSSTAGRVTAPRSQNCFDVLCAALLRPEGKALFMAAEGVELMWLMLQKRRQCRWVGGLSSLERKYKW
jgi:hypothetical protein